jgi:hypothetical protein
MHEALEVLDGLVLEDGRRWGEAAASWQRADARAVLDVGAERLHFLTRPRGGSKTTDLAGVSLAALLVQAPARSRSYGYAADRAQAGLLLDALGGFVQRTPGLGGAVTVETLRAVLNGSGASLTVESSDDASSWGRRPWLSIVDELAQWPDAPRPRRLWSSVVSALPKVPGSRLAVLTSPGDPAGWAFRVLEDARASSRWRTSEVPGPVPWLDPEDLAEQRAMLADWEYARLHEGRWVGADDRLVDVDGLRACVTLDGPIDPVPGRTYVAGVDVGLKHDRTAVAVCHAEPTGDGRRRVVLDRLLVFAGTRARPVQLSDVEAALLEVHRAFRPRVRLDPWQAVGLAQRLRAGGVRVDEVAFTRQSVGRLASTLHLLLRDGLLALPPDEDLVDELANVRLRETSPGVVRMDHDPGRHDDMAVALGLAASALLDRPGGVMQVLRPTGAISDALRREPQLETARRTIRGEVVGLRAARAGAHEPNRRGGLPVGVADRLALLRRSR